MKKYAMETGVGVFMLIGLLCVGYLTIRLGDLELLRGNTYLLNARFTSAAGLNRGSVVEMAGVGIGKVESIRLHPTDLVAIVTVRIDKGVPIFDDSVASIKTRGLIGDKFIDIAPGGSDFELGPGETIVDTVPALDIENLIGRFAFGDVKK
ncbi:phospholipid/cholesterol/gamma-HCH transport system substrate-binding protein [Desulfonatronum zhilinae]|nr:phospholipid/cholesterol/gamma-HCH transport system substrate-binding protein [Desulfonatronum zhilinae]